MRQLRLVCRRARALTAGAVALVTLSALSLAAATPEREIRPVDDAAWNQVLANHVGEIVVVDFWATWCLPCLDRFPAMVKLAERYSDRGVTFIAFSLDDLEDAGAMRHARRFVTEQGGRIENYVTAEPITGAFDQLGLLGIPAVYVYDREGKIFRRLTTDDPNHQFTDEDVEHTVRELLGMGLNPALLSAPKSPLASREPPRVRESLVVVPRLFLAKEDCQPHRGLVGGGPGNAVPGVSGDQQGVARAELARHLLAFELDGPAPGEDCHPFGLLLVVPEPLGRALPERNDALDASAAASSEELVALFDGCVGQVAEQVPHDRPQVAGNHSASRASIFASTVGQR